MTRANSARKAFASTGSSAKEIDRDLQSFRRSAAVLSSEHKNLIAKYDGKWVGVHNGKVAASGRSMKTVRAKISKAGVPPEQTIFRFIEKTKRTMIL